MCNKHTSRWPHIQKLFCTFGVEASLIICWGYWFINRFCMWFQYPISSPIQILEQIATAEARLPVSYSKRRILSGHFIHIYFKGNSEHYIELEAEKYVHIKYTIVMVQNSYASLSQNTRTLEFTITVPRKCVKFRHSVEKYEKIQLQAFIKRNT